MKKLNFNKSLKLNFKEKNKRTKDSKSKSKKWKPEIENKKSKQLKANRKSINYKSGPMNNNLKMKVKRPSLTNRVITSEI